jgi:hydroxylamine reductase (hybrid-cluster protein)
MSDGEDGELIEVIEDEAGEAGEAEEAETITVQIGDDEPEDDEAEKAPPWVRDLRKSDREKARRIKELEAKLSEKEKPADTLGPKPTLESCDFDGDKFEEALLKWKAQRDSQDEAEAAQRKQAEDAENRWQNKLERLNEQKRELKAPDYEEAEDYVKETFSVVQQGIVIQGAKNPALLCYALGKNPKKSAELAAITDPIEFAFAVANVEAQLKVGTKGNPPPPEREMRSGSGTNGSVDKTLDRLREKAMKTGDFTEVVAHKNKMKAKAA